MKRPTQRNNNTILQDGSELPLSKKKTLDPSRFGKEKKRKRRKKRSRFSWFSKVNFCISAVLIIVALYYYFFATEELSDDDDGYKNDETKKLEHQKKVRNQYTHMQNINNPHDSVRKRGGPMQGHRMKGRRPVQIEDIGDFSEEYKLIKEKYEKLFPPESISSRASFVDKLRKRKYEPIYGAEEIGYDVFNCPDDPPDEYPVAFPTLDIIENWNPDDPEPRTHIYQGICVFQYDTEYDKAVRYRELELPFVIRDDPEVLKSVERWNHPNYLHEVLGDEPHRAEFSENNHFMYWTPGGKNKKTKPRDWKPPTENIRMTYPDWLSKANITDNTKLGRDKPHWYFRLIGCGFLGPECDKGHSEWLYNDLSFFNPTDDETLYLIEPKQEKGIHCRFGMKGVIAENHFDATRNMIVVLGGERRYILSDPEECQNLCLYPMGHPSARHSAVDWSEPDVKQFPAFANATSNEIVLQAGDVLYLPTYWFHYIISLELNFQCNARSGKTEDYHSPIEDCGFH